MAFVSPRNNARILALRKTNDSALLEYLDPASSLSPLCPRPAPGKALFIFSSGSLYHVDACTVDVEEMLSRWCINNLSQSTWGPTIKGSGIVDENLVVKIKPNVRYFGDMARVPKEWCSGMLPYAIIMKDIFNWFSRLHNVGFVDLPQAFTDEYILLDQWIEDGSDADAEKYGIEPDLWRRFKATIQDFLDRRFMLRNLGVAERVIKRLLANIHDIRDKMFVENEVAAHQRAQYMFDSYDLPKQTLTNALVYLNVSEPLDSFFTRIRIPDNRLDRLYAHADFDANSSVLSLKEHIWKTAAHPAVAVRELFYGRDIPEVVQALASVNELLLRRLPVEHVAKVSIALRGIGASWCILNAMIAAARNKPYLDRISRDPAIAKAAEAALGLQDPTEVGYRTRYSGVSWPIMLLISGYPLSYHSHRDAKAAFASMSRLQIRSRLNGAHLRGDELRHDVLSALGVEATVWNHVEVMEDYFARKYESLLLSQRMRNEAAQLAEILATCDPDYRLDWLCKRYRELSKSEVALLAQSVDVSVDPVPRDKGIMHRPIFPVVLYHALPPHEEAALKTLMRRFSHWRYVKRWGGVYRRVLVYQARRNCGKGGSDTQSARSEVVPVIVKVFDRHRDYQRELMLLATLRGVRSVPEVLDNCVLPCAHVHILVLSSVLGPPLKHLSIRRYDYVNHAAKVRESYIDNTSDMELDYGQMKAPATESSCSEYGSSTASNHGSDTYDTESLDYTEDEVFAEEQQEDDGKDHADEVREQDQAKNSNDDIHITEKKAVVVDAGDDDGYQCDVEEDNAEPDVQDASPISPSKPMDEAGKTNDNNNDGDDADDDDDDEAGDGAKDRKNTKTKKKDKRDVDRPKDFAETDFPSSDELEEESEPDDEDIAVMQKIDDKSDALAYARRGKAFIRGLRALWRVPKPQAVVEDTRAILRVVSDLHARSLYRIDMRRSAWRRGIDMRPLLVKINTLVPSIEFPLARPRRFWQRPYEYCPPEQLDIDQTSLSPSQVRLADIWSSGIMLLEFISDTSRCLIRASAADEDHDALQRNPFRLMRCRGGECLFFYERVLIRKLVKSLLHPDPAQRHLPDPASL